MRRNLPNILTITRLIAAPMMALIFAFMPRGSADLLAVGIFVAAAATDWLDGRLARRWQIESAFGAMLDPIADKAMVVIALAVLLMLGGYDIWLLLPVVVILFREVFVSGLREYLGEVSGALKVTKLAKWKTTFQMTAISVLLFSGVFASGTLPGQDAEATALLERGAGGGIQHAAWVVCHWLGLALLWAAAVLTLITGIDYFRKALPYLTGRRQ